MIEWLLNLRLEEKLFIVGGLFWAFVFSVILHRQMRQIEEDAKK